MEGEKYGSAFLEMKSSISSRRLSRVGTWVTPVGPGWRLILHMCFSQSSMNSSGIFDAIRSNPGLRLKNNRSGCINKLLLTLRHSHRNFSRASTWSSYCGWSLLQFWNGSVPKIWMVRAWATNVLSPNFLLKWRQMCWRQSAGESYIFCRPRTVSSTLPDVLISNIFRDQIGPQSRVRRSRHRALRHCSNISGWVPSNVLLGFLKSLRSNFW